MYVMSSTRCTLARVYGRLQPLLYTCTCRGYIHGYQGYNRPRVTSNRKLIYSNVGSPIHKYGLGQTSNTTPPHRQQSQQYFCKTNTKFCISDGGYGEQIPAKKKKNIYIYTTLKWHQKLKLVSFNASTNNNGQGFNASFIICHC